MNSRTGLSVLMTIYLLGCSLARASNDFIDVKVTPGMREYCRVVRFLKGWKHQRLDDWGQELRIDYNEADYEFRIEGLLGTEFLVGAFSARLDRHLQATNHYRVDLSDPAAPAKPASNKDWTAAAIVPLTRKSIFPPVGTLTQDRQAVFNGFGYIRSGVRWPPEYDIASRVSPDSAWVVLQSETDATKSSVLFAYRVFFDVFNTETGKKVVTIEGTYSGNGGPEGCLIKTAWLTERYFVIPLGKQRERCLVCEFNARRKGKS